MASAFFLAAYILPIDGDRSFLNDIGSTTAPFLTAHTLRRRAAFASLSNFQQRLPPFPASDSAYLRLHSWWDSLHWWCSCFEDEWSSTWSVCRPLDNLHPEIGDHLCRTLRGLCSLDPSSPANILFLVTPQDSLLLTLLANGYGCRFNSSPFNSASATMRRFSFSGRAQNATLLSLTGLSDFAGSSFLSGSYYGQ